MTGKCLPVQRRRKSWRVAVQPHPFDQVRCQIQWKIRSNLIEKINSVQQITLLNWKSWEVTSGVMRVIKQKSTIYIIQHMTEWSLIWWIKCADYFLFFQMYRKFFVTDDVHPIFVDHIVLVNCFNFLYASATVSNGASHCWFGRLVNCLLVLKCWLENVFGERISHQIKHCVKCVRSFFQCCRAGGCISSTSSSSLVHCWRVRRGRKLARTDDQNKYDARLKTQLSTQKLKSFPMLQIACKIRRKIRSVSNKSDEMAQKYESSQSDIRGRGISGKEGSESGLPGSGKGKGLSFPTI